VIERKTMIDHAHRLSVAHQCELLALSRSTLCYLPVATLPEELALMRRIDVLHLKAPVHGLAQSAWTCLTVSASPLAGIGYAG
jgi:hypothetical protein